MDEVGREILRQLNVVERLRAQRDVDPLLGAKVRRLKAYQAARFTRTYADLLASPGYRGAARFFLDELYGPQEFAARDTQFARIVPALVRMFPAEVVHTVSVLANLHALSETLDQEMASRMGDGPLDAPGYAQLWQATGQPESRQRQIDATIDIGSALARYTRNPVLRGSLRLMRRPARMAGLGELQRFLESGFETFGAIADARQFLSIVRDREQTLARALFDAAAVTSGTTLSGAASRPEASPLGQLP